MPLPSMADIMMRGHPHYEIRVHTGFASEHSFSFSWPVDLHPPRPFLKPPEMLTIELESGYIPHVNLSYMVAFADVNSVGLSGWSGSETLDFVSRWQMVRATNAFVSGLSRCVNWQEWQRHS